MSEQTTGQAGQPREIGVDEALQITRQLLGENRLEEAEKMIDMLRAGVPDHPDVLHFQGILRFRCGAVDEGLALLRRAIAAVPECPDFHLNLGNMLADSGEFDDALGAFEEARRLRPDDPGVWNNLGSIYRIFKRFDDAEAALLKAIELDAEHLPALISLGSLCEKRKDFDRACDYYRRFIALRPQAGQGYQLLSELYRHQGNPDEQATVLREWLAVDPDNPVAKHYYAACGFGEAPERATDDYVAHTFDRFAASFDSQLQERLRYRAPELIVQALEARLPPPDKQLAVLDAGCGTGLCGPLIAPWATSLSGVDLSGGMLAKAQAKHCYDHLEKAELTDFLARSDAAYDVVLSADTLCYFGSLEAVSGAAITALRPGGLLAFTVELLEDDAAGTGYRLDNSGRYLHTREHVSRCLAGAGFEDPRIDDAHLRTEGGKPVEGLVVTATRPAA